VAWEVPAVGAAPATPTPNALVVIIVAASSRVAPIARPDAGHHHSQQGAFRG
jgi:hypothetical protein